MPRRGAIPYTGAAEVRILGFLAWVPCRCFEQGLTTPPPVPLERLVRGFCGFDLPDPLADAHSAESRAVGEWQLTGACAHRDMQLVSTSMSKIALGQIACFAQSFDETVFPTLSRMLYPEQDSLTSPEMSAAALAELAPAVARYDRLRLPAWVDSTTGYTWYRPDPGARGVVETHRGARGTWRVGLTRRFIFARRLGDRTVRPFRARRIEQVVVPAAPGRRGPDRRFVDDGCTWIDRDRGVTIRLPWVPVSGRAEGGRFVPPFLHVELRPLGGEEFHGTLATLRSLLEASVETGNPIHWFC